MPTLSPPITPLRALAERLGILSSYVDNAQAVRETSDETRRALLAALGYFVADDGQAVRALAELDEQAARQVIAPGRVARIGDAREIDACFPAAAKTSVRFELSITPENGGKACRAQGRARVDGRGVVRGVRAPALPAGTYVLKLRLEAPQT